MGARRRPTRGAGGVGESGIGSRASLAWIVGPTGTAGRAMASNGAHGWTRRPQRRGHKKQPCKIMYSAISRPGIYNLLAGTPGGATGFGEREKFASSPAHDTHASAQPHTHTHTHATTQ